MYVVMANLEHDTNNDVLIKHRLGSTSDLY